MFQKPDTTATTTAAVPTAATQQQQQGQQQSADSKSTAVEQQPQSQEQQVNPIQLITQLNTIFKQTCWKINFLRQNYINDSSVTRSAFARRRE